ncbi:hypothetical protein FRC12_005568 [Ceratobasidium sp. 428]|nr:hypothetical protein FRC12_005568 [Ceratobasidium sp. 428]
MTLRTNFGSFKNIAHAKTEDLQLCPGFGPTKVRRLRKAFNKTFHSSGQKPLGIPGQVVQTETTPGSPDAWPADDEPGIPQPQASTIPTPPRPATRHSSPEWDIDVPTAEARPDADLDLDLDLNPSDEETGNAVGAESGPIPATDVNLDDQLPTSKRQRPNE